MVTGSTSSACTKFGSATAPLAKGLGHAADELEALQFPAADQSAANSLITQLRKVASVYRTLERVGPSISASVGPEAALIKDNAVLTTAAKNLRHVLHLPAASSGEFVQL